MIVAPERVGEGSVWFSDELPGRQRRTGLTEAVLPPLPPREVLGDELAPRPIRVCPSCDGRAGLSRCYRCHGRGVVATRSQLCHVEWSLRSVLERIWLVEAPATDAQVAVF